MRVIREGFEGMHLNGNLQPEWELTTLYGVDGRVSMESDQRSSMPRKLAGKGFGVGSGVLCLRNQQKATVVGISLRGG